MTCTGSATPVHGDHLGYGGYADSTVSDGDECACSGSFEGYDESYYVNSASFDGTFTEPYRAGTATPHADFDETGRNPNPSGSGWTVDLSPSTSSPYVLDGTWNGYTSPLTTAREPMSCGEDALFNIDIREVAAGPTAPPSDDSHECGSAGSPVASRFRLLQHPGGVYAGPGREAVPVYHAGSASFGNVAASSLRVLDFDGVDAVRAYAGPILIGEMTPSAPVIGVPGAIFGQLTLVVLASDGEGGEPDLRMIGTCATTGNVVNRPTGYRVTSAAFNAAFGVTADATARIMDDADGDRTLLLEVPGTTLNMGLPLVSTGGNNYSLDYVGYDLELHATIVHAATALHVTVTSGTMQGTSLPTGTLHFPVL